MQRYFAKFDDTSTSLLALQTGETAAHLQMKRHRAQAGVVTEDNTQQSVPLPALQTTLDKLLDHGYTEMAQPAYQSTQVAARQQLLDRFAEKDRPGARLVGWPDLPHFIKPRFANAPDEYLTDPLRSFFVLDAPMRIAGDLHIGYDALGGGAQTHTRNLVYKGALTIDGNLDAGSSVTSLPQFIHIDGDLHVNNLLLTGWADVVVTGNVYAKGLVLGYDGESGGRLQVGGSLHAAAVLGGGMYQLDVAGPVHAKVYWMDDDEPTLAATHIQPCTLSQADWLRRAELTSLADACYFEDTDWVSRETVNVHHFALERAVAPPRAGTPPPPRSG